MIEMPDEKILSDIIGLLQDNLPKVLANLEEQSVDGVRHPPFWYVGDSGLVPPGTGLPHAYVEIAEGEYTEKDRIVRNTVYSVRIQLKLADMGLVWRYLWGVEEVILQNVDLRYRVKIQKSEKIGVVQLKISR